MIKIFRVGNQKSSRAIEINFQINDYMIDKYSQLTVKCCKDIILYDDFTYEGILVLNKLLIKAINSELQIKDQLCEKGIGYTWNIICNSLANDKKSDDDRISIYHVWSTTSNIGKDTWLYNIGDKIYMEISDTYKWHFSDPESYPNYITFQEFIVNYKPINIIQLEREDVNKMVKFCQEILSKLNT